MQFGYSYQGLRAGLRWSLPQNLRGLAWVAGLQPISPPHHPLLPLLYHSSTPSLLHSKLKLNTPYLSLSLSLSQMEGLIPFVYRAIVQYKNGGQRSWLSESPSCSYILLPGDSGRFQTSDIQLFRSDYAFSATSSSSMAPSANAKIMVSTGVQSPARRMTSRRVVTWMLCYRWYCVTRLRKPEGAWLVEYGWGLNLCMIIFFYFL